MTPFPPLIQRIVDSVYPIPRQLLADQLASISHPLYFVYVAIELAFLLWFYFSGASASLRTALETKIKNPLLCAVAFIAIGFAGLSVLMLPMSFYGSFVLSHQFGLSAETVGRWLRDWLVSLVFSAAVASIVGALLLRAVARWRAWPLIAAAGAAVLLVFGNAIFPVFIAPLVQHVYAAASDAADACHSPPCVIARHQRVGCLRIQHEHPNPRSKRLRLGARRNRTHRGGRHAAREHASRRGALRHGARDGALQTRAPVAWHV